MPTFRVWSLRESDGEFFWVHAIDDFDARDQVSRALNVAALDECLFGSEQDRRFKLPLNRIMHSCGEWTEVPLPNMLRCRPHDEEEC